jgi:hypothetical protein
MRQTSAAAAIKLLFETGTQAFLYVPKTGKTGTYPTPFIPKILKPGTNINRQTFNEAAAKTTLLPLLGFLSRSLSPSFLGFA